MKGKILPDHLIVKIQESGEEKTKSGIIILADKEEKPLVWAEVCKLGHMTKDFSLLNLKEGDIVFVNKSSMQSLELNEEKYHMVHVKNILFIK